jgi:hypothetical protein
MDRKKSLEMLFDPPFNICGHFGSYEPPARLLYDTLVNFDESLSLDFVPYCANLPFIERQLNRKKNKGPIKFHATSPSRRYFMQTLGLFRRCLEREKVTKPSEIVSPRLLT